MSLNSDVVVNSNPRQELFYNDDEEEDDDDESTNVIKGNVSVFLFTPRNALETQFLLSLSFVSLAVGPP